MGEAMVQGVVHRDRQILYRLPEGLLATARIFYVVIWARFMVARGRSTKGHEEFDWVGGAGKIRGVHECTLMCTNQSGDDLNSDSCLFVPGRYCDPLSVHSWTNFLWIGLAGRIYRQVR